MRSGLNFLGRGMLNSKNLKRKEKDLGQRPWLPRAEGTPMPELALVKLNRRRKRGMRACSIEGYALDIAYLSWD